MKIKVPTLLIDEEKCRKNISKMAEKAKRSKAELRPHFKTHHSATIASWFRDYGITKCTASSVSMASYFAKHGWDNITIAFPYNLLEHEEIDELAGKINLNILLESEESLAHAKANLKNSLTYLVKIDVGYHRTGIDHHDEKAIKALAMGGNDNISFGGFLAHSGNTYGADGEEDIKCIYDLAGKALLSLKEKFGGILSYGDTPSCSVIEDLSNYDELRPGNFVFYDWMQHEIGSCTIDEIATCMACPIVSIHQDREEVVIYGGAVHLSKDVVQNQKGKSFGKVVKLTENGWDTSIIGNVDRISQEHGILKLNKKFLSEIKVGDIIGVIPVHSCLAADIQGHYLSTRGEHIDKISKI